MHSGQGSMPEDGASVKVQSPNENLQRVAKTEENLKRLMEGGSAEQTG